MTQGVILSDPERSRGGVEGSRQYDVITLMASGEFLQSSEWEKFQISLSRKVFRINGVLIIKMPLPFGFSYLYSPKTDNRQQTTDNGLVEKIKNLAKRERAVFWRVEPQDEPPKNFIKTKDAQPRCTLITDISKPEDEILTIMHEKTRYNIRLAEKKGVKIRFFEFGDRKNAFEDFYSLLQKTSERQDINLHPKNYYEKLMDFNYLFIAYYDNVPVASAMVNFHKVTATYLHGGSSDEHKNVMAPHLLHWEIMKTAKARGCKFYDWWGIDEKKWPGITRFKRGFGGKEVCAPGTYDLPVDKFLYFWYKLLRK